MCDVQSLLMEFQQHAGSSERLSERRWNQPGMRLCFCPSEDSEMFSAKCISGSQQPDAKTEGTKNNTVLSCLGAGD